jgi:CelD/BcsL family acetyltransferase involved in cellulose biosynthesis
MPVYEVDPLNDSRWATFVSQHPRSSVFHTPQWLEVLARTYKYQVQVLTSSPTGVPLKDGIVLSKVSSWLTGTRLVSLPFSDHCEPLVGDPALLPELLLEIERKATGLRFVELRPRFEQPAIESVFHPHSEYFLHSVDLRGSLDTVYSRLHKDGVQRKIRRADNENVILSQGRSPELLHQFYGLQLKTRRRHQIPPQPFVWFQNLLNCFDDRLSIYVANLNNQPIASILSLRHNESMVYKYGCSDEKFHNVGAMPRLFWQLFQDAHAQKLKEVDLGRSEPDNTGLIRFKDHLGATKTPIRYWRSSPAHSRRTNGSHARALTKNIVSRLPNPIFQLAGRLFYRHAG